MYDKNIFHNSILQTIQKTNTQSWFYVIHLTTPSLCKTYHLVQHQGSDLLL